jgi:hypothetical protein
MNGQVTGSAGTCPLVTDGHCFLRIRTFSTTSDGAMGALNAMKSRADVVLTQ